MRKTYSCISLPKKTKNDYRFFEKMIEKRVFRYGHPLNLGYFILYFGLLRCSAAWSRTICGGGDYRSGESDSAHRAAAPARCEACSDDFPPAGSALCSAGAVRRHGCVHPEHIISEHDAFHVGIVEISICTLHQPSKVLMLHQAAERVAVDFFPCQLHAGGFRQMEVG